MKHIGKMKNNGARIVIAYRTLPGDPHSALVVGTQQLMDAYHDGLMSLVESDMGQQADELADVMAVRRFPDGTNMLHYVHTNGFLKKVPTSEVLVTPDTKSTVPLNELNNIIAQQRGITLNELAVKDGANATVQTLPEPAEVVVDDEAPVTIGESTNVVLTPAEKRSRADALYKEAARLRKEADEAEPVTKKAPAKPAAKATTKAAKTVA